MFNWKICIAENWIRERKWDIFFSLYIIAQSLINNRKRKQSTSLITRSTTTVLNKLQFRLKKEKVEKFKGEKINQFCFFKNENFKNKWINFLFSFFHYKRNFLVEMQINVSDSSFIFLLNVQHIWWIFSSKVIEKEINCKHY